MVPLLAGGLLACGSDDESEVTGPEQSVASVQMSPERTEVVLGEDRQLSATPVDAEGNELAVEVRWSSSQEVVATVDETGLVTAQSPGTATITAMAGEASDQATVEIPRPDGFATPGSATRVEDEESGVVLQVPAGAVDEQTEITIRATPSDSLPSGEANAGYVGGSAHEFGPDGLTFAEPATLTLRYEQDSVPEDTQEVNVRVRKLVSGSWEIVEGSAVDTASNTATAEIDGFSSFGTVAEENRPPSATIEQPADGATFAEGEPISFAADVTDPEDRDHTLDPVWEDSQLGTIAIGDRFTTSSGLPEGDHTITLTVTDSEGATATDQIGLTVTPNDEPDVTISSPSDGATFQQSAVTFKGSADDTEDGAITGDGLEWRSDEDGDLGTGGTLTVTLSAGTHTITLTATDSDGAPEQARIEITVEAASQGDGVNAFVANGSPNRVWSNDGAGTFAQGAGVGSATSRDVALGDLNGDNLLDVFVANDGPNRVWLGDGEGGFTDSGQSLGRANSGDVALGDLNGDNLLDVFIANDGPNRVWLGDGSGGFTDSGQSLGDSESGGVALGDLNGDNLLDAFVANREGSNRVWLGDGEGGFTDSGQTLGSGDSQGVALGDLNGDNLLDVFVANDGANRVWYGDGSGGFTDSGQSLGQANSGDVALGDLNGDNLLDAFVPDRHGPTRQGANRVWLNGGSGGFTDNGQSLGSGDSQGVALGDLNGDNLLDVFVANDGSNRVWLNDGSGGFTDSGQSLGGADSRGVVLLTDAAAAGTNEPPTASISSPSDGSTFQEGESITFEGSADDAEDGAITGDGLEWASDVDGGLGTGETVTTTLSAATHTITLTATDSDGATDQASIEVTVEEGNSSPTASISSPSDGSIFQEGESITFEGSADDAEDGAITGDGLEWASDVDGGLGTGETVTTTLSAATHTITLTATDSDGATDQASIEVTVEGPTNWAEVSARGIHSCAVTDGGTVFCWGSNSDGQLGDGTETDRTEPVEVTGLSTVTGSSFNMVEVNAGRNHSCAIRDDRTGFCWGGNSDGQVGDGTTGFAGRRTSAQEVAGDLTFAQMSTGGHHTCGVIDDGTAYCWGDNDSGELGDGTTTTRLEPVEVAGGLTFAQISAGDRHTCGVTTDGTAYCWGDNGDGRLGDGSTTDRTQPVQVAGSLTFSSVIAGDKHTCGLTESGTAYCWGNDSFGQLGDGSSGAGDRSLQPGKVAGDLVFTQVTTGAGDAEHTCGLTGDGTAYCWGENTAGELGDGTTTDRNEPVQVSGGISFVQVSAGTGHTCGVAEDGTTYCWGFNRFGQLGDGTTTSRTEPVKVAEP